MVLVRVVQPATSVLNSLPSRQDVLMDMVVLLILVKICQLKNVQQELIVVASHSMTQQIVGLAGMVMYAQRNQLSPFLVMQERY